MGHPPPGPVGRSSGKFNYSLWQADIFGFLSDLGNVYGDIVGFELGNTPCILVNGAKQVRELFRDCETYLRKPEFVKDSNRGFWGDGLTTLESEHWRHRRAALRPIFTAKSIPARQALVSECTTDMLDEWRPDTIICLRHKLRMLAARIATRTILGADVEGFGSGANRSGILSREQAFGEDYHSVFGGDSTAPLSLIRPRAPQNMDSVIRMIDARIETQELRGDVLSDLMTARHPNGCGLTRDEIISEVMQMLFAGHLTIPSSLMDFWRNIAGHYSESRIATEADSLSSTEWTTTTSWSKSYCLAALKESLRLHPPAPIIYREVDTAFELDGHEFASDSAVWVCPQLLHRDGRYYPEPDQYIPERFTRNKSNPKNNECDHASASSPVYMPFGTGPRTCLANHQALRQMALIGIITLKRFRLIPTHNKSDEFRLYKRE